MLDTESKRRKEQQKQKVKKRYNVTIDPENYLFIPAKSRQTITTMTSTSGLRFMSVSRRMTSGRPLRMSCRKSIMKSSLLGIRTGRWLRSTLTKVSVVLPSKSGMSLIE